ncbi:hypothetical protein PIB30_027250 [Stylosanthes scabra]|uniref:Ubiquitin-like protease family profile domain-containing protein n=1 Tax=Stylosanthes scabra TaxID=79078 RepID=A0ABU6V8Q9_9FABA|nr:hypothetical protein [Stylosanthes scabra]
MKFIVANRELLVPSPHCNITRGVLRSLEPARQVAPGVMTLLAQMLSKNSSKHHWFLPTTITEIAISRAAIPHHTVAFIREEFMGKADDVYMIYCPIFSDNHWILLLIDVLKEKLIYVDSLKRACMRARRRRLYKRVADFLEELMDEAGWYNDKPKQPLLITDFKFLEPDVVEEDLGSGMFVAQWMIMYHLWGTFDVEKVTNYSRMRLAVDMVLKEHNESKLAFIDKALEYWRFFAHPNGGNP